MIAALYALLYVLAAALGWPLGFALFGRRHAGGWIAGSAIGYALTAVAIWAPIRLGIPSPLVFLAVWAAVAVAVWMVAARCSGPLAGLAPWGRRDWSALLAVLILTLCIAVPPLARAGASDASGNRYYRAYFTADFVWHEALTVEVAKFAAPPRNPYLAHRPIHYYWTYFLLPAAAVGTLPDGAAQVEGILKVNATGTALLFVAAIFLFAWTVVPRAWPVAAGVATAIVASSAEGTWALWRFWQRGVPLAEVRNLNVDALTAWWPPHGLRIDGLSRCFWWVPQHSMAYALGLVALATATAGGSGAPFGAMAIAGLALGGATLMNPFVGGVFSLVWGTAIVIEAAGSETFVSRLTRAAVAGIPVVLAVAWCAANQMVEGAGGALQIGWLGGARSAPFTSLMLSLGPAIVAAASGLFASSPSRQKIAPLLLAIASLAIMHLVRLDVDTSWVGFRAGQMFLVAVPGLIAAGLATGGARRLVAIAVLVCAALAGAPTTLIDVYNAQDITNFSESPNGPWTVTITRDEREGLDWLRRATPASAVVQMDPFARERSTWSLIPSFAQRRMAAGRPISLLGGTEDGSEYGERSRRVKRMYETSSAQEAWEIAHALRVEYLWIDRTERAAYPAGTAKFESASALFEAAYQNPEVRVYRVH